MLGHIACMLCVVQQQSSSLYNYEGHAGRPEIAVYKARTLHVKWDAQADRQSCAGDLWGR